MCRKSMKKRQMGQTPSGVLAERGGFEPPVRFDPYTAFPVPHNRPLCHLSLSHFNSSRLTIIAFVRPLDTRTKRYNFLIRSLYLDANATSPLLPEAMEAMRPWLGERFGKPASAHQCGRK